MMGTKNNPGQFDCYAKADPDEPIFTLRANDPNASDFVAMWAALRMGDLPQVVHCFDYIVTANHSRLQEGVKSSDEKTEEAFRCANDMRAWRRKKV
jgi:hypothetical protein